MHIIVKLERHGNLPNLSLMLTTVASCAATASACIRTCVLTCVVTLVVAGCGATGAAGTCASVLAASGLGGLADDGHLSQGDGAEDGEGSLGGLFEELAT